MSLHEYKRSRALVKADEPFYGLLMAAMAKADSSNAIKLQAMWPEVWAEAEQRYNAPGGRIGAEVIPQYCPGEADPRCFGKCTLRGTDGLIADPDCFR